MLFGRLRSPLVAAVAAGVLLVLGLGTLASLRGKPAAVKDLERADAAGARVQRSSAELVAELERISENLEPGHDLKERTGKIHSLTVKQNASLSDVAGILQQQIGELRETIAQLRTTYETTAAIARASEGQAATLHATLVTLQRLRALARSSSATSADLTRFAEYGARLARDSQRSFSMP